MKLSHKDRINTSTVLHEKNIKDIFMTVNNQVRLTKTLYQMHKNNGGIMKYVHFRTIIPKQMENWIQNFCIEDHLETEDVYIIDQVYFLNKMFVKQNDFFYKFTTNENINIVPDTNPYKLTTAIADFDIDGGETKIEEKKYTSLLAHEYGQVDVWREQTTEVTNNVSRYCNKIPVWQRSMNNRYYDQDNEGYANTIENSSHDNILLGYGDTFKNLQDQKLGLLKKNTDL